MASDAAVVSYEDQFLTFLAVWLVPRHRTRPDARPRAGRPPPGSVSRYLNTSAPGAHPFGRAPHRCRFSSLAGHRRHS